MLNYKQKSLLPFSLHICEQGGTNKTEKITSQTKIVRVIAFIAGNILIILLYTILQMFIPFGSMGFMGGFIRAGIFIGLYTLLIKCLNNIQVGV